MSSSLCNTLVYEETNCMNVSNISSSARYPPMVLKLLSTAIISTCPDASTLLESIGAHTEDQLRVLIVRREKFWRGPMTNVPVPERVWKVPDSFARFKTLRVLYLNGMQLDLSHDTLTQMSSIFELNLAHTNTASLPDDIGLKMSWIMELDMAGTPLSRLPASIGNLQQLKRVTVRNTLISTLPTELGRLPRIEDLFLQSTPLIELPTTLGNLGSSLRILQFQT